MDLIIKFFNCNLLLLFTILLFPSTIYSFSDEDNNNVITANDKLKTKIISGRIIDAETNKAIPFCNIIINEKNYATSSNEEGDFYIKVDSLPSVLIISHLSYETQEIKVINEDALSISLTSLENVANLDTKDSKLAIKIVNNTINGYNTSQRKTLYGRSLYRQKSKNNDSFSEFAEIIYDVAFNNDGIIDWDIFVGRYASKKETINNKNFTLISKILRVHQPNSDDLIFPLIDDFTNYYSVKIINIINTDNGNLVTIKFTPLEEIKTPIIAAEVIINTTTYEVIKVNGSLTNDNIKIITLGDKDALKKNYKLNFEISYREDDTFGNVLDYVNINHEFDYFKNDKLLTHLYATSSLNFFEYFDEKTKVSTSNYVMSDLDHLDTAGYNESFWNTNPILKRTEIESEIVENFKNIKAFQSVFLNSKEQISVGTSNISNDPFIRKVSNDIGTHYTQNLTQKIFLHTDKNNYSKGNKLYYSAYVTSEKTDSVFNDKDVLYVDLLKGSNIVDSQIIKINNGRGYGTFSIDENIGPGNLKIVAYTNFMKNFDPNDFFIKEIEILGSMKNSASDKITLNFYPEGGQIINGISNKVAYEAQDSNWNFKDIQGKIVDSDNNFIATIKSKHEGLGFFYFTPKKGKSYTVILDDYSEHPIPTALNSGYSMMVNNSNSRTMMIDIRSSDDLKSNKIYVLGLMNNKKYYQGDYAFEGKDLISIEIPKTKLPGGVMQLILMNASKKVIGNRAVYINTNDNIDIAAQIDKNYVDEKFVKLLIKTTPQTTLASDISLAITTQFNEKPVDRNDNILAHFKLSSFPKDDRITKYINKTDRASNYKLDLMMLINDSVDLSWLEGNSNYQIKKYQSETNIDIKGIAKDGEGNLLKYTKLKLLTKSKERIWNYETKTDKNGIFTIHNFEEVDSTDLEFRTYSVSNKQFYSKISLIEKENFNYLDKLHYPNKRAMPLSNDTSLNTVNSAFSEEGEVLENIELKVRVTKKKPRNSIFNIKPDNVIEGESLGNGGLDIRSVMSRVPGVRLTGGGILVRGTSPLWIVDGMEMEGMPNIMMIEVERIEIVKSLAKLAVYGPRLAGRSVVMVYYKKYKNDIATSSVSKIYYNSPEEFNYDNDDTLFWSPLISSDKDGFIEVIFNKPSNNINFINLNIQAMNKNGEIGYYNKTLKLE